MSLRRKRGIIWCVFGLAFLCVLALYVCPPAVQGLLTAVGFLAPIAALVLHGINRENAGRYRTVPVMISGAGSLLEPH